MKEQNGVEVLDSGVKRTGAMLATARTEAGLELADIARETRVPLRHLKALEADTHEDLPALPYAIGFVKSFARAVNLDPEAVAAQFRAETSKSAHVPAPLSLEPLDERRLPSRGLVAASVGIVALVIGGLSAWGAGLFDPDLPETTETVADASAPGGNPGTDPAPIATGVAVAGTPVAGGLAPTAPAVGGPVVLTAREEVWVKIYDRASRTNAKIGIMQPGESFTVPADQPGLVLLTGKAGALDVTVAGRAIPPLGGAVETVRDVSLLPADLIARTTPAVAGPQAAATAAPGMAGTQTSGLRPIANLPGT